MNQYDINYDFFSNIQKSIGKELKKGNITSLLALNIEFNTNLSRMSFGSFDNIPIWQNSSPQESVIEVSSSSLATFSIPQVSLNQNTGMRMLPSKLDVQILQTILAEESPLNLQKLGDLDLVPPRLGGQGAQLEASLTSEPLLAIANGDSNITDTTINFFA